MAGLKVSSVQAGSVIHQASHQINTGDPFPGGKRPQRGPDHSPSSSTEVKDAWS